LKYNNDNIYYEPIIKTIVK